MLMISRESQRCSESVKSSSDIFVVLRFHGRNTGSFGWSGALLNFQLSGHDVGRMKNDSCHANVDSGPEGDMKPVGLPISNRSPIYKS
jgi:hypothetical protein